MRRGAPKVGKLWIVWLVRDSMGDCTMTTLVETPEIALAEDDGRHRLGRPGLAQRRDLVSGGRRRGHRHAASRLRITTEGIAILLAIVSVVVMAVGGWYAAPGAH